MDEKIEEILKHADSLISQHRYHDALSLLSRQLKQSLSSQTAMILRIRRCEVFIKVGLFEEALRDAHWIHTQKPTTESLLRVSSTLLLNNKREEAIQFLEDAKTIEHFDKLAIEEHVKKILQKPKPPKILDFIKFPEESQNLLECPLCFSVFLEPNGTVFHVDPINHPTTIVIHQMCQILMGEQLKQRQKEAEEMKKLNLSNVPLFVLNTVVFPGTNQPLHVFEPRYKLMIRRCMEGSRSFGIVLSDSDGTPKEYGTIVEITEFEMLPDGRSLLQTIGRERFKILNHWEVDGYAVGEVELIEDEEMKENEEKDAKVLCEKLHMTANQLIQQLTAPNKEKLEFKIGKLPLESDAKALSFYLGAFMPFSNFEKFQLLKMTNTIDRLKTIDEFIAKSNQSSCTIM